MNQAPRGPGQARRSLGRMRTSIGPRALGAFLGVLAWWLPGHWPGARRRISAHARLRRHEHQHAYELAREAEVPRSLRTAREGGTRKRLSAPERRALIMEAAARVFAERGYSGASMTDIAAAAGIAPSVIYDHFPSKRDLHLELLSGHIRQLIEATTLDAEGSVEAVVRRGTEAFFSFVEQHPYAWRMLFRDPPADAQIAALHAQIHRQGAAAIAGLVHRAPAADLPAGIPRERADEMLAQAIKSSNDGLAAWWYEHPEVPREQVIAVAIALCWRGLAALTGAVPGTGPETSRRELTDMALKDPPRLAAAPDIAPGGGTA